MPPRSSGFSLWDKSLPTTESLSNANEYRLIIFKIFNKMNVCFSCETPLTKVKGTYRDYAYCAVCNNDIYIISIDQCCKESNLQPVQTIISNGTFQIRNQCQHCKSLVGGAISRSKVSNPDALPKVSSNKTALITLEYNQVKERIVSSYGARKTACSTDITSSKSHPGDEVQKEYSINSNDITAISNLLNYIEMVFIHDWSFTYSMIKETDSFSWDFSPFTPAEDQNWQNMTGLAKSHEIVSNLLKKVGTNNS